MSAAVEEENAAVIKFDSRKHKHRLQSFVCKALKQKICIPTNDLFDAGKAKMGLQGLELDKDAFETCLKDLEERNFITVEENMIVYKKE